MIGYYSKKFGTSNYYETLSLSPDSTFYYQDGVYVSSSKGPYMPVMTTPPRAIGKGKYVIKNRELSLFYDGVYKENLFIDTLQLDGDNAKVTVRIFEGQEDSLGLIGAHVVLKKTDDDDGMINGIIADFDGRGEMNIKASDFPLKMEVTFVGIRPETIILNEPNSYHIEVIMSGTSKILYGTKKYKIKKKNGRYMIDGMVK